MANPAKILLEQLTSGAPVPGHSDDQVAQARALVASPGDATASAVAALPDALALAVIEAAVAQRSVALLHALTDKGAGSKELAKAAKRALHQLRSAGVAVPDSKPSAPAISARPIADATLEPIPSLLTPLDGTGDYGLIVVRPVPPKFQLNEVVVNDGNGAQALERLTGPRSHYRAVMRTLNQHGPALILELTDEEVRTELGYAIHRNHVSGTPFPAGLHVLLGHFEVEPLERPALPPIEPSDEQLAIRASALFDEPLVASWLPPEAELRRLADRLGDIDNLKLEITDAQRADQIQATIRDEAARFFTPEIRRLYAQRLWMTARFLEKFGSDGSADIARAEARRLFHGPADSTSNFAITLFERVLRLSRDQLIQEMKSAGL